MLQTTPQGYPNPGFQQRYVTLQSLLEESHHLRLGSWHLRVTTNRGASRALFPRPTMWSQGRVLPSAAWCALPEGFCCWADYLFQWDVIFACETWFSFSGKLPFPPCCFGCHSQKKNKKPTYIITKTFKPTCVLLLQLH